MKTVRTHDLIRAVEWVSEHDQKEVVLKPDKTLAGVYVITPQTVHSVRDKPLMKIGMGNSLLKRIDSFKTCFAEGVNEIVLMIVNPKKVRAEGDQPGRKFGRFLRQLEKETHELLKKSRYEPLYETYTTGRFPEWFEDVSISHIRKMSKVIKTRYGDQIRLLFPYTE
jgi:hypothetical protein